MTLTDENYHDPAFKRLLCNPNFINKLNLYGFTYTEQTIHVLAFDYASKGIITLLNLSDLTNNRKNNVYCFYLPQIFSKTQMDLMELYKNKLSDLYNSNHPIVETMAIDKDGNDAWDKPLYSLEEVYDKINESYYKGYEDNGFRR